MKHTFLLLMTCLLISCAEKKMVKEDWVEEIRKTEQAFAHMADSAGIQTAFIYYAADDAVLTRTNQLIKGKKAIDSYYAKDSATYRHLKLSWKPDFIDVSETGDLAYTYGQYKLINTTTGETKQGVFHTVWKRQNDGSWRYVWD